jgi:hypothetical protein
MLSHIPIDDPLDIVSREYVSETGLTKSDIIDKIDKIKSCCSVVELQASYNTIDEHTSEQVLQVSNANFCKQHAVCPVCADRSQNRRRARYNEPIKEQASRVREGQRYAYIVTYTVTDGNSLSERLRHLKQSRLAWRKMGQKRKDKRSNGEAAKIKAGLSTIEIKRGRDSGLWHVHAHELLFTDKQLDYQVYDPEIKKELYKKFGSTIPKDMLTAAAMETAEFQGEQVAISKISKEWLIATSGDSISISVEPLQHVPRNASPKRKRKLSLMSFEQSIAFQAKEVLKYITDPVDNSPDDMLEIITDTYNKRMVATYGEFRGVPGDDYEIQNKEDSENYVVVWDQGNDDYKSPVPGRYKDFAQEETDTRKEVAKLLGQYRRERRAIILQNGIQGIAHQLDMLKLSFKENVNKIWQFYRNKVRRERNSQGCDNYNPVLAMQELYIQATSEELWTAAFS